MPLTLACKIFSEKRYLKIQITTVHSTTKIRCTRKRDTIYILYLTLLL